MYCSSCGSVNAEAAKFCEKCGSSFAVSSIVGPGTVRANVPVIYASGKSPGLAAFLSFVFPTLAIGQFYNGDTKKGLTILGISLIAIPLWLASGFGSILDFAIWVWSVVDAYRVAKRSTPLW